MNYIRSVLSGKQFREFQVHKRFVVDIEVKDFVSSLLRVMNMGIFVLCVNKNFAEKYEVKLFSTRKIRIYEPRCIISVSALILSCEK